MSMVNNLEVNIVLSPADEEIASEILQEASQRLILWQELVEKYKTRGVSIYKLRKIILALISRKELIELKCRLFATKAYLQRKSNEELISEIKRVIELAGLRKCGKPITIPYERINITISRQKGIRVYIER